MSEVLVEVKDLSRFYGNIPAVKNISFSVAKGEVLGFLGPNGAGKTTTMQIITGNLAPSVGSISIAGHDLLEDPREAKAAIGYLPEQPPVYRELTVDEYLDYAAALNRIERSQRLAARDAAKEKCGLTDVSKRLIGNLSKGYQQRVGIAQAIIHMPPVVILDEPTVGLDPIQIREIRELILGLGQDHSVILSSHILPEIQMTCSRVQIINRGELVMTDTIEGLEQQLAGNSLTLRFRRAPTTAQVESIPGILKATLEKDDYIRAVHEVGDDPTDALVKTSVENNWGLAELRPGRISLEDIFVELTTTENSHKADPEDAA
ncbi:MAG: ABC transporter ATP-binding protein [Gammaproteobacteria bacterium]|nr:ABC transporter ATP-binding protein [Gammaproteobacteria bacterium]